MGLHHVPAPSECMFGGSFMRHDDHFDTMEPACSRPPEFEIVLNPDHPFNPGRCPHCGGKPKIALCERHTHLQLEHVPPDSIISILPFKYSDQDLEHMALLAQMEEQFGE